MITTECPACGNTVPVFAASCRACGAPNRARFGAVAVAGSLVALVVAVAVAAVFVLRWQEGPTGSSPEDFTWLSKAMAECDAEATKAPTTLHFLVVPLISAPADDAYWRQHSLNDIGNAILLRQSETFDGLGDQSLRIAHEQYEFSVRDEKTEAVYRWTPSVGVKKFLIADGTLITEFKVQFKTQSRTQETNWGAPFVHSKGTCYWVNAIIGH
jgi:hypothetical protein